VLYVTSKHIGFQPNRFDSKTGGVEWSAGLADVVEVALQDPELDVPFLGKAAKLRKRLRVMTPSGTELFGVNGVGQTVAELSSVAARRIPTNDLDVQPIQCVGAFRTVLMSRSAMISELGQGPSGPR
jgi:hypothetical protein